MQENKEKNKEKNKENKEKNKENKKEILIVINLIIIAMLFTYFNILLEYPKNNQHLFDKSIELKWNGNYEKYKLYIDDNKEFESPVIKDVTGNFYKIDLDFGTYYWRIETEKMCSATWTFAIDSRVAMDMIEKDKSIEIKNTGNTDLDLEVRNPAGGPTGFTILDLPYQESREFEKDNARFDNAAFIGKQK